MERRKKKEFCKYLTVRLQGDILPRKEKKKLEEKIEIKKKKGEKKKVFLFIFKNINHHGKVTFK